MGTVLVIPSEVVLELGCWSIDFDARKEGEKLGPGHDCSGARISAAMWFAANDLSDERWGRGSSVRATGLATRWAWTRSGCAFDLYDGQRPLVIVVSHDELERSFGILLGSRVRSSAR